MPACCLRPFHPPLHPYMIYQYMLLLYTNYGSTGEVEGGPRPGPVCRLDMTTYLLTSSHLPPPVLAGKPKGVVHTTGGYMVYTATTSKHGAHGGGGHSPEGCRSVMAVDGTGSRRHPDSSVVQLASADSSPLSDPYLILPQCSTSTAVMCTGVLPTAAGSQDTRILRTGRCSTVPRTSYLRVYPHTRHRRAAGRLWTSTRCD